LVRELDALGGDCAALLACLAGAILCLLGFFINRPQLFRSWLFAHQFFLSLALGGLAMLMVHHLMGGQWGILVERILEAMAHTLPLLALLFIPIFFGMKPLYIWTHADEVATNPHLQSKAAYLNTPSFIARAVLYFVIWIIFAWLFRRWSLRRDREPALALAISRRMVNASALGLIVYFLTMTFAAIDWMMSLEPEWYSTIYGSTIIMSQGLQALALASMMLYWIGDAETLRPLLRPKALIDLGNMLLAFLILWTYMAFVQYLIIWMGNLKEEVPWVLRRSHGGWQGVAVMLIVLNFFLPFFLLLFRAIKRDVALMLVVAAAIQIMRLVGMHWLIAPAFHPTLSVHWLDLAALAAVGGFWTAVFLGYLGRVRLVPLNDPREHPPVHAEEGAHP
jgi:hypothetical protein